MRSVSACYGDTDGRRLSTNLATVSDFVHRDAVVLQWIHGLIRARPLSVVTSTVVDMEGQGPAAAWLMLAQACEGVVGTASGLWALSNDELLTLLREDAVAAARWEAARLSVLRELDWRGVAGEAGAVSTASWLAQELLMDPRVAAADVLAARRLDPEGDIPPAPGAMSGCPADVALAATGRALASGQVSRAQADVVAHLVASLPTGNDGAPRHELHDRAEAFLLGHCQALDPARLRRLGRHLRHVIDPDGMLADERVVERAASFWIRPDQHGPGVRFGGVTDAVTGAQLQTFIDAHSAPRPETDPHSGAKVRDTRTADQRRGEAFAQLVRLAVNADPGISGGQRTQLVVTTTLQTLQARLGEKGIGCADAETGQPFSAALTRRLACDATVIPMVLGSSSEPLDVGRATQSIPTAIRRALVARDRHCAFPGCDRPPRWADAHHIWHWADGGPTCVDNLVHR